MQLDQEPQQNVLLVDLLLEDIMAIVKEDAAGIDHLQDSAAKHQ